MQDEEYYPGPSWEANVFWNSFSPAMQAGDLYINSKWRKGEKPLYWLCTGDPQHLVLVDEEVAAEWMTMEPGSITRNGPAQPENQPSQTSKQRSKLPQERSVPPFMS